MLDACQLMLGWVQGEFKVFGDCEFFDQEQFINLCRRRCGSPKSLSHRKVSKIQTKIVKYYTGAATAGTDQVLVELAIHYHARNTMKCPCLKSLSSEQLSNVIRLGK